LKLASFSREELHNVFVEVDKDHSDYLDRREMSKFVKKMDRDLSDKRVDDSVEFLIRRFDRDGDGRVTFDELWSAINELEEQHRVASALAARHKDATEHCLLTILKLHSYSESELREEFTSADVNNDGLLDRTDVANLFLNHDATLRSEDVSFLVDFVERVGLGR